MIKLPARRLLIVGYSNPFPFTALYNAPVAAEKYLGFSFERRFSVLSHFLQGTNSKNLSSRIVVSATAQLKAILLPNDQLFFHSSARQVQLRPSDRKECRVFQAAVIYWFDHGGTGHPGLVQVVIIVVVFVNDINVTIVIVIDNVLPIYKFDDDGGQAVIVRRSDLCPTRPDVSPVTLKIH